MTKDEAGRIAKKVNTTDLYLMLKNAKIKITEWDRPSTVKNPTTYVMD